MIIANGKIRHNGVVYETDDEILDIDKKEAERLVNLGVAFFIDGATPYNVKGVDFGVQLDENFNATELKEAAQEVGLEFPGNISKANLIELIITSEKAQEVLSVEFEEYEEEE